MEHLHLNQGSWPQRSAQRYDAQTNIGKLIGWMLPQAIALLVGWVGLLIICAS